MENESENSTWYFWCAKSHCPPVQSCSRFGCDRVGFNCLGILLVEVVNSRIPKNIQLATMIREFADRFYIQFLFVLSTAVHIYGNKRKYCFSSSVISLGCFCCAVRFSIIIFKLLIGALFEFFQ